MVKFIKIILKILHTLRLIPAIITLIYALVLKLLNISFSDASGYTVALYIIAAFSILYFFYGITKPFIGEKKTKKPKNNDFNSQRQNDSYSDGNYNINHNINAYAQRPQYNSNNDYITNSRPIYYKVAQNENYVFSEYEDRYELFLKTESGLKYVKTDYKDKL